MTFSHNDYPLSMHHRHPLKTANNTDSPSTRDTRSKSANRQGIKQTSSASSSASTSTEKSGPICWNCGEAGHLKRNCPNPPYCSECKQKGHLPVKCPQKEKRREASQTPQKAQRVRNVSYEDAISSHSKHSRLPSV